MLAPLQVGVAGLTVLVVGTMVPWVEAILLARGAARVVTLDYAYKIRCVRWCTRRREVLPQHPPLLGVDPPPHPQHPPLLGVDPPPRVPRKVPRRPAAQV